MIVNLIGGLGNQMFQYAYAYSMWKSIGSECFLDASSFDGYKVHQCLIQGMNISIPFASPELVETVRPATGFGSRLINLCRGIRQLNEDHKDHFQFNKNYQAKSVDKNVWVNGYWQSYKYFECVEAGLRVEFRLAEPMSSDRQDLLKVIEESGPSVALHVRLGDYYSNEQARKLHGVDLRQYYVDALRVMKDRVGEFKLFVFSDEPEKAVEMHGLQDHQPIIVPVFGDGKSHEDMMLMAACRHQIIANSSFSWWGAWLNTNPDKVVIAPKKWTNNPRHWDNKMHPDTWVKL